MYISELNLHGFKSFAKKEKLKFGEGVTVIVGPNGCGKTNIVDAIRWVLGEQKYSVLRSGKMGDVIFNGADGLKPLSVCEAFLTVHNNQGKLPLEYNDIEIGRRVFRDGESEYYINRTPCRLKDIHDLFVDTGMGSDAYSVIELKMIEQILSETADDRKRMFEEAAGINKYKQRRRSALRKFDAVQQDLERISDVIQEVEQKVNGLNLQLKRFKRHEKLSMQLKEKELSLAFIKIHEFENEILPLQKQVINYRHLKDEAATDTSANDRELSKLNKLYSEQQSELNEHQNSLNLLEAKRESIQNNVIVCKEKDRSADENIQRLNKESLANADKKILLGDEIKTYDDNVLALTPELDKQLKRYKLKKEDFDKVQKKYEDAQKSLNSIQNMRWDAEREMSDNKSLLDKTLSLIDEKNNLSNQLNDKAMQTELDQKAQSKEQKKLDREKTDLNNVIQKDNLKLSSLQKTLNDDEEELSQVSLNLHKNKGKLEFLQRQLSFYNELVEKKEGYPEGVRNILDSPDSFPETIGTVGELFQVDQKYKLAFESALGDWVNCIIAKDRKSALKIASSAKLSKVGSFSILPLKEISKLIDEKKTVPKGKGILGTGDQLSGVSEKYNSIAKLLAGNLLIVEDLEQAMNLYDLPGWNLVDLSGSFSGGNFLLKVCIDSVDGNILGRKKKIESLKKEIKSVSNKINILEKKFDSKKINIDSNTDALKKFENNLDKIRTKLSEVESGLVKNHYIQSQSTESLINMKKDLAQTNDELKNLKNSVKKLKPQLDKSISKIEKLKKDIDNASKLLLNIQSERDDFQQTVQKLRIDLLNLENQRDTINLQSQVAKETIHELKEREKQIEIDFSNQNKHRAQLKIEIQDGEKELKNISAQIVKDRSLMELKKETVNSTYESIQEIQLKIRNEQERRESLIEEMKTNELKIVELEQKIKMIVERIQERYQSEIPKDLIVDEEVDDLELRIEKIQRGIESIGPINMAVQDEFEEQESRLEILIEQRVDLISSEDNLRETIQKIDKVAREKFQDTFDKIKINFSKLFELFFEGGTASLTLVGDPDPLESDITIHAQPPGKKNQSLRMLSAGEKSLTAIALLFAIYQYKPSPYCILDEVDAPLDDVNIQKFKKVLNKFSDDTQFIVVTHNKLTMEIADYLYGVTMEQKGVSKLVSVKFDGEA